MPETTNAEEAMNFKIYAAVGQDHNLMDGLYSLLAVAEYYYLLYLGTLSMWSLVHYPNYLFLF
jgi:hypothetical protein